MSGHNSAGRVSASQAEGRGFESRCPLQFFFSRLLAPKTRIFALQVIVVIALFGAGCGSPRTTVGRNDALEEAVARYVDGDLERAEALFTRIISAGRVDEDNLTAYLYLGRIYLAQGDYEKAADAFSTGRALGGDIRFTEYFEEAQRHLTASPRRIIQVPRVTRGQLAALIEITFGSELGSYPVPADTGSSGGVPAQVSKNGGGEESGAAPREENAIELVVRAGVMSVLPDGDFHAADEVTGPAFYAVVQRLARVLEVEGDVVASLFPGGARGAMTQTGTEDQGPAGENPFVSGRDAQRVLGALAEVVHSGDE
jgi:hypothetical protein